jgi:4-hydroxy-3-methylbut-2-enyl diphosphate reductase
LNIDDEITGKIIKLEPQKDIYKIIVSPKAYEDENALKSAKSTEETNIAKVTMEGKLEDAVESKGPETGTAKE